MTALFRLVSAVLGHPLNRGRARGLAALSRVLRWQLASRLLPEAKFVLPYANGVSLVVERGMVGATGNFYGGLDEPDEMGFLAHVLQPDDIFIDIGANVGSYSMLAASLPGTQVISFEPVPATYERLLQNVAFNRLEGRVQTRQQGVSDATGELRFTANFDSMNRVAGDGEGGVSVPVVRLDDVTYPQLAGKIVLKIDVEGFEMAVLGGAQAMLQSGDVLCAIIETNGSVEHYGGTETALFERMAEFGFMPWNYSAQDRKLRPGTAGDPSQINTIFIRDVAEVERRVAMAPKMQLPNGLL